MMFITNWKFVFSSLAYLVVDIMHSNTGSPDIFGLHLSAVYVAMKKQSFMVSEYDHI